MAGELSRAGSGLAALHDSEQGQGACRVTHRHRMHLEAVARHDDHEPGRRTAHGGREDMQRHRRFSRPPRAELIPRQGLTIIRPFLYAADTPRVDVA
jgi:hypothetical protein